MMDESIKINVGDKVYHKSDSSTVWVVEKLGRENKEAHCSTLDSETKKLIKERFLVVTLGKINEEGSSRIVFGGSRNKHSY
jgi:hypothetical protein